MPQSVLCEECDTVLYEGVEVKSPYEILKLHEGKCPKCKRKLSATPIRVEVKSVNN